MFWWRPEWSLANGNSIHIPKTFDWWMKSVWGTIEFHYNISKYPVLIPDGSKAKRLVWHWSRWWARLATKLLRNRSQKRLGIKTTNQSVRIMWTRCWINWNKLMYVYVCVHACPSELHADRIKLFMHIIQLNWLATALLCLQTVRDMYLLAEEIIDGVPNEHFKTTNKFEDSEEIDWIDNQNCECHFKNSPSTQARPLLGKCVIYFYRDKTSIYFLCILRFSISVLFHYFIYDSCELWLLPETFHRPFLYILITI